MLFGKVKFSEHAHARISHIDTSRAERLPGVRAVVTAYNTPQLRIGFLRDNFALKRDRVRQFRDELAAVAAIDPEIAVAWLVDAANQAGGQDNITALLVRVLDTTRFPALRAGAARLRESAQTLLKNLRSR